MTEYLSIINGITLKAVFIISLILGILGIVKPTYKNMTIGKNANSMHLLILVVFSFLGVCACVYASAETSYAGIGKWKGNWTIKTFNSNNNEAVSFNASAQIYEESKVLFKSKELGHSKFSPRSKVDKDYSHVVGNYTEMNKKPQNFELSMSTDKQTFIAKIAKSKHEYQIWVGERD